MLSGVAVYLVINNEKPVVNKNMIEEIADKVSDLLTRKKESEKQTDRPSKPLIIEEKQTSVNDTNESADSLVAELSQPDTLAVDSAELASNELVVKKDMLLLSNQIEVFDLSGELNRKTKVDSLLEQASGIKSDKKTNEKIFFTVEFWVSPVNYRGYKLGKNKVILFGLDPEIPVSLYKTSNGLFMKQEQFIFKLEPSNDFRAFEKISDPILFSLFNRS